MDNSKSLKRQGHCEPKAKQSRDCHVADAPRNDKSGFTLLETMIACGIMVMAFAILAVIFGRAYTISKTIKRGSNNQRWGASLMNTILYGPGKTATEGLIAAYRVYHPDTPPAPADDTTTTIFPNAIDKPHCLSFYTPNGAVIYELVSAAQSLYRNINAGDTDGAYNPTASSPYKYFDLKPTYAKDGKLEIYYKPSDLPHSSGFYFYKEDNTPAATTSEIKRVGIKLVIKNTFQDINQAIVLYQNVRIRNLYSSELE